MNWLILLKLACSDGILVTHFSSVQCKLPCLIKVHLLSLSFLFSPAPSLFQSFTYPNIYSKFTYNILHGYVCKSLLQPCCINQGRQVLTINKEENQLSCVSYQCYIYMCHCVIYAILCSYSMKTILLFIYYI